MLKLSKNVIFIFSLLFANSTFAINRLIIKFKPNPIQLELLLNGKINNQIINKQLMLPLNKTQLNSISTSINMNISDIGAIATGAHILRLPYHVNRKELEQLINIMQKDPNIAYIEEDIILKPLAPALNPVQWDMQLDFKNSDYPSWTGDNFIGAWSLVSSPGNSIIAAVVDTGYTPHTNIISNLQQSSNSTKTYGYSFISDCRTAGTCPASTPEDDAIIDPLPDALDLGDSLTQEEIDASNGFFAYCDEDPISSWHGTHVTGTIVAQGYNEHNKTGILGGAYYANVVPVRVLGKCGGRSSDVINGMLWAANLHPSIKNNNPASIINLSLGANANCSKSMQDAINQISNSSLIVVAAGNSSTNIANAFPANCKNVVAVAAKGPINLAYYSNYGATNISASGGDMLFNNSLGGILSTIWTSTKLQNTSNSDFTYYQGTSMAAPHVVAAIADILSYLKSNNLLWNNTRIIQILQNSSIYDYNNCNSEGCAASGALNVEKALNYVINNYNQILEPNNNTIAFLSHTPQNQTIKFTNNNNSPISISEAKITENSDIFIKKDECSNQTLLTNDSCQITLSISSNTNTKPSFLRLLNTSGIIISTINIDKSLVNEPPTPPQNNKNGGGGCAINQNGSDLSLLLMLIVVCFYFFYKNIKQNHFKKE
ncbi:MAG TPA: S8 family serine peptidase [Burkholderiales bacterium]|nr:S8 family serine peptidase [Burkholderiales bacterium]